MVSLSSQSRPGRVWGSHFVDGENHPDLVILDGLAEALAAEGQNEDKVGDVLGFFRSRLRPFAELRGRCSSLRPCHESTEDRGRWARGSGAKLGRYDGVSYSAELAKPYSPTQAGKFASRSRKTATAALVLCTRSLVTSFSLQMERLRISNLSNTSTRTNSDQLIYG